MFFNFGPKRETQKQKQEKDEHMVVDAQEIKCYSDENFLKKSNAGDPSRSCYYYIAFFLHDTLSI